MVALQIRLVQLRSIGTAISLLCVPVSFLIMMFSAITSESENGYLAVHKNSLFRFCKRVLLLSLLNMLVVFSLFVMKIHEIF